LIYLSDGHKSHKDVTFPVRRHGFLNLKIKTIWSTLGFGGGKKGDYHTARPVAAASV